MKWWVRVIGGLLAWLMVVLGDAAFADLAATDSSVPLWLELLPWALVLGSATLTYAIFFGWPRTHLKRSLNTDDASRRGSWGSPRLVGGVLIALGAIVLLGSLAYLFVLGGLDTEVPVGLLDATVGWADMSLLMGVSAALLVVGFALWRGAPWGTWAAIVGGFMVFGGYPVGTLLALYIWWVLAPGLASGQKEAVGHDPLLAAR